MWSWRGTCDSVSPCNSLGAIVSNLRHGGHEWAWAGMSATSLSMAAADLTCCTGFDARAGFHAPACNFALPIAKWALGWRWMASGALQGFSRLALGGAGSQCRDPGGGCAYRHSPSGVLHEGESLEATHTSCLHPRSINDGTPQNSTPGAFLLASCRAKMMSTRVGDKGDHEGSRFCILQSAICTLSSFCSPALSLCTLYTVCRVCSILIHSTYLTCVLRTHLWTSHPVHIQNYAWDCADANSMPGNVGTFARMQSALVAKTYTGQTCPDRRIACSNGSQMAFPDRPLPSGNLESRSVHAVGSLHHLSGSWAAHAVDIVYSSACSSAVEQCAVVRDVLASPYVHLANRILLRIQGQ